MKRHNSFNALPLTLLNVAPLPPLNPVDNPAPRLEIISRNPAPSAEPAARSPCSEPPELISGVRTSEPIRSAADQSGVRTPEALRGLTRHEGKVVTSFDGALGARVSPQGERRQGEVMVKSEEKRGLLGAFTRIFTKREKVGKETVDEKPGSPNFGTKFNHSNYSNGKVDVFSKEASLDNEHANSDDCSEGITHVYPNNVSNISRTPPQNRFLEHRTSTGNSRHHGANPRSQPLSYDILREAAEKCNTVDTCNTIDTPGVLFTRLEEPSKRLEEPSVTDEIKIEVCVSQAPDITRVTSAVVPSHDRGISSLIVTSSINSDAIGVDVGMFPEPLQGETPAQDTQAAGSILQHCEKIVEAIAVQLSAIDKQQDELLSDGRRRRRGLIAQYRTLQAR